MIRTGIGRPATKAAMEREASAVYDAEFCLQQWNRKFGSLLEAEAYALSVVHSDWFDEEFDTELQDVDLTEYRRFKTTNGDALRSGPIGFIRLKAPFNQKTVLHELAHVINDWEDEWHGPVFCGIVLRLVRHEMGFHAYGALLQAYRNNKCLEAK